jgi:hypothetical protein
MLIPVVPGNRLQVCDKVLAVQFKDKKAYRLSHPESVKYKQAVLFGVRRTRGEREQLRDRDVERARALLSDMSRKWEQLPFLSTIQMWCIRSRKVALSNWSTAGCLWT